MPYIIKGSPLLSFKAYSSPLANVVINTRGRAQCHAPPSMRNVWVAAKRWVGSADRNDLYIWTQIAFPLPF
jgi:hypothetical protein